LRKELTRRGKRKKEEVGGGEYVQSTLFICMKIA
jgi:hypothetical protein